MDVFSELPEKFEVKVGDVRADAGVQGHGCGLALIKCSY
jgi:hypothetical protein